MQLSMVLMGYLPVLNVLVIVVLCLAPHLFRVHVALCLLGVVWLLLVPPIVVRLTLAISPLPNGDVSVGSATFLRWWFVSQWQVIYNRLPLIEEMLRLFPGVYSAWLRLWGARVGRFVYWTPGVRILDRPLVDIGDGVVFGAGVRINPHIILPGEHGRLVLRLGRVCIGARSLVGGYALLLAGVRIAPDEATPGGRVMRPFSEWINGKRSETIKTCVADDSLATKP